MSEVNYLLLFKGNSDKGGPEASVRSFTKLETARTAMAESHRKKAAAMNIPVRSGTTCDPYTAKTENSIRLERYGDVFQWEIIKAVPEDGGPDSIAGHSRPYEMKQYTIEVEERFVQKFPVRAYDIFHALQSAENQYKRGTPAAEYTAPSSRLIMVQDDASGEKTEWKKF